MKHKKASVAAIATAAALVLSGCAGEASESSTAAENPVSAASADPNLDATELISPEEGVVYVDVRTPEEFAEGHLEGAVNLDFQNRTYFSTVIKTLGKDTTYKIYCRSGNRSAEAAEWMKEAGLTVVDLGGFEEAQAETGFEVVR